MSHWNSKSPLSLPMNHTSVTYNEAALICSALRSVRLQWIRLSLRWAFFSAFPAVSETKLPRCIIRPCSTVHVVRSNRSLSERCQFERWCVESNRGDSGMGGGGGGAQRRREGPPAAKACQHAVISLEVLQRAWVGTQHCWLAWN